MDYKRCLEHFCKNSLIIQNKLPYLFQVAEVDNSRNGKLGMEIGSARERIIIALIISKFGKSNVDTDIPITENELDVILHNNRFSIKTCTGKNPLGVKLIWTVDKDKSLEFASNYQPDCHMIYVHINWGDDGGFYIIERSAQLDILKKIGRERFFKLPKAGTNPRGVEISKDAITQLLKHKSTFRIRIEWYRSQSIRYTPYDRWVDMWNS